MNIYRDIQNGNLPVSEVPGFMLWLFRKTAWLAITIILASALGYLLITQ